MKPDPDSFGYRLGKYVLGPLLAILVVVLLVAAAAAGLRWLLGG